MIAALTARGVRVVTHDDAPIHVSGHARADEIEEMIGLIRPTHLLVPVHGELPMQGRRRRASPSPASALDRSAIRIMENG